MEKKIRQAVTGFFDFIDKRDADKHLVCVVTLMLTFAITKWAMGYAETHTNKPGMDVAMVIAAVTAPYMALQAAVIRFYFNSRPSDPPTYITGQDPPPMPPPGYGGYRQPPQNFMPGPQPGSGAQWTPQAPEDRPPL